jgi:hypothetical protein
MCLLASYKNMKKKKNFSSDPELEPDPYPLDRGTDPGILILIRTKMSRIPNTNSNREGNGRPWPKSSFYTLNGWGGGEEVSHTYVSSSTLFPPSRFRLK